MRTQRNNRFDNLAMSSQSYIYVAGIFFMPIVDQYIQDELFLTEMVML